MADKKERITYEDYIGFRVYEIAAMAIFVLPIIFIAMLNLQPFFLYAHIFFAHVAALVVVVFRFSRKSIGRNIDIEIVLVLTLVDLVTRFYLPPMVHLINNIIIFSALLVFLYRQTKVPILKNSVFMLGYSFSYFVLNYKLLDFGTESFWGILYSVILSIFFAYTLLAAHKVKNLYRATFCAGVALLTIIILGKRVYGVLHNPVVILQAVDNCLLAFCFIHWNNGRSEAADIFGKTFFNVGILPNTILFVSVILYSFNIPIEPTLAIYGLVLVVFLWYLIFVCKGFWPVFKTRSHRPSIKKEIVYSFSRKQHLVSYFKHISR